MSSTSSESSSDSSEILLSNFDADVLSAKISTFGEMVEDIFHLKKNNSRIGNSRNLLRLRTMIEKNIIKSRDKVVN